MNILNYTCTAIVPMPLMASKVQAGFPSPADDYMDKKLDLNEYLITHPNSTFFVRATGESMIDAGIMEGSLLVVDKSIKPTNHKIVIAVVNEEFTVKRLKIVKGQYKLTSENSNYHYIKALSENDFIWGVVIAVVTKL